MIIAALFTIAKSLEKTQMSIDRQLDQEDVVYILNGILLSHKKNDIMPFVATWMELVKSVRKRKTNTILCNL